MACDQALMEQEQTFMMLLQSAFQFQVLDNKLTIFSGDQVLNFTAQ